MRVWLLNLLADFITDPRSVVAMLAILLSQLPPVHEMVRGRRLRIAVADRVNFFHWFGSTRLNVWIDLENVGGRRLTISTLVAHVFTRDRVFVQTLDAKSYRLKEDLRDEHRVDLPLNEIALARAERWSAWTGFMDATQWDIATEREAKALVNRTREDIQGQIAAKEQQAEPSANQWLEVAPALGAEIITFTEKHKRLKVGEYILVMAAHGLKAECLATVAFDFTIFDADAVELFQDVEDYKYGCGTWFARRTERPYVYFNLRRRPVSDARTLVRKVAR